MGTAMVALVLLPSVVLAQAPAAGIQIISPKANQAVGNSFNVMFSLGQQCIASGRPNITIYEPGDNAQPHGELDINLVRAEGSTYTFSVDATLPLKYKQAYLQPPRYLNQGQTSLVVMTDTCQNNSAEVAIDFRPNQSIKQPIPPNANTVNANVIARPKPTPSATPAAATLVSKAFTLPTWAAVLLGALIGAGLLLLAEASAIAYLRRRSQKAPKE